MIVFCDQGDFKKLEGLEIKSSFNLKQLRNILTLFGYNVSKKIIFYVVIITLLKVAAT